MRCNCESYRNGNIGALLSGTEYAFVRERKHLKTQK